MNDFKNNYDLEFILILDIKLINTSLDHLKSSVKYQYLTFHLYFCGVFCYSV